MKKTDTWSRGRAVVTTLLPHRHVYTLLLSLALANFTPGLTHARSSQASLTSLDLSLQDGTLTARISATPVRHVLAEVARLTGAQVHWLNPGGQDPVSVAFRSLRLSDALRRILGRDNFMLFYTSTHGTPQLTRIVISTPGDHSPQARLLRQPEQPQGAEDTDALIQTALEAEDPSLRLRAMETLASRDAVDARTQAMLSQLASSDPDAQIQAVALALLEGLEDLE